MGDVYYDAFISYSTQDTEFVTKIRLMLELSGRRVWQDIKDIELTDQWWAQIKAGIAASDNFLFVVSPRAMASPICHLELEHARQLKKRVIIIRYESADPDTSTKAMVERILTQNYLKTVTSGRDMFGVAEENWRTIEAEQNISITSDAEMLNKVPKLIEAFDKDLLYIRQGNILLGRATEWQESGQNPSFLLVGEALNAAEVWRDAGKRPAPTDDHLAYITASREEENRRRRELRNLRIGRLSFATVGTLAAIVALASLMSLNDTQRRAAIASTQVVFAEATVTQAAIVQQIAIDFANAILQQRDGSRGQIAPMDALVQRYPDEAQAYLSRGLVYTQRGDFAKAIADFSEVIRLHPNDAIAYNNRGNARRKLGQLDGAIADFNEAIRLDPNNALAYNNRGLTRRELGELDGAIADFSEAIRLDPNYVLAYNNRGLVRRKLGDMEGAIVDFSEAIRINPDYAQAYNNRGVARYESGNIKSAIEDYNEAIRINPDYAQAYNNRGLARRESGGPSIVKSRDLQGAIADFSEAIRLDPNYAEAYSNRGKTRRELGDLEGALSDYTEAIRLDPNFANAYWGRGNAYYGLNRYAETAADYRRYEAITGQLEPFMIERLAQIEAELGGTPTPTP